jgi:hypothetical protein
VTIVDNAGIARVKTVPVRGLAGAARAESEAFAQQEPDAIAAIHRWRY